MGKRKGFQDSFSKHLKALLGALPVEVRSPHSDWQGRGGSGRMRWLRKSRRCCWWRSDAKAVGCGLESLQADFLTSQAEREQDPGMSFTQ